jgi:AcrR family transcriptional regulator
VPRSKVRTEALRERAVASALALLADHGVAGLTAREVARRAEASVPAVYEVFGDKAGLVREVFFEGFRMLDAQLSAVPVTADPLDDLRVLAARHRRFVMANPVLAEVMFSRPFAAFDPSRADLEAGTTARRRVIDRVRLAISAGALAGDPTDTAHVFFALIQGLAAAESSHRLGRSRRSVDRRWRLALDALFGGLSPTAATS